LILVETQPPIDLKTTLNYRNEIYSLIERIAVLREGVRRIEVPVGLILTKWDRLGNISWNPETETQRALEYIQKTDWLRELYDQLKVLCPIFQVFPIFSFIGDKPSKDDIRPFNLKAPLIWATDQSDISFFNKYKQFAEDHKTEYHNVMENYWRLLNVEKICNPQIRKQIEKIVEDLSPQYLEAVHTRVKKNTR